MKRIVILALVVGLVVIMSASAVFATGGRGHGGHGGCNKNSNGITTSSERGYPKPCKDKGHHGKGKGHCKSHGKGHHKNKHNPGHKKHHKNCKNNNHNNHKVVAG